VANNNSLVTKCGLEKQIDTFNQEAFAKIEPVYSYSEKVDYSVVGTSSEPCPRLQQLLHIHVINSHWMKGAMEGYQQSGKYDSDAVKFTRNERELERRTPDFYKGVNTIMSRFILLCPKEYQSRLAQPHQWNGTVFNEKSATEHVIDDKE